MNEMILLMIFLIPLAGSVVNGIILRSHSVKKSGSIATICSGLSFLCALKLLFTLLMTHETIRVQWSWFQAGTFEANWGFQFDALTAVMALVVTGIGTLIHLYSIGYMSEEEGPYRYFAYLNLFLFNMCVLITGDSLPVLFVGWEGVGLCSYLLIGYWYQDPQKARAGMKAFVVNRIGDAGFLLGMFLLLGLTGTLEFYKMSRFLSQTSEVNLGFLNIAAFFLFVGATGKSAQIPLYVWLPDAMAGPTPVSALIHAATMVTAGVYMIVRMSFLFQVTAETNQIIAAIGIATSLVAALIATSQNDIKKVLAYSTVSQLGLMFLGLGMRAYTAAIFHVVTHAFFKALLFLGAGSVIHGLHGEQDVQKMGGLKGKLPITFVTFAIATLAIAGIPPFSGFFSKDALVYSALVGSNGYLYWILGLTVSFLTALYMGRLLMLVFMGDYRGSAHPHESPSVMWIPLLVLAIGSAFAGFLGFPHEWHIIPNVVESFLVPTVAHIPGEATLSENAAMLVAILVGVSGLGCAVWIYSVPGRSNAFSKLFGPLPKVFSLQFGVDELYDILFVEPFEGLSRAFAKFWDPLIDRTIMFPGQISRATGTFLGLVQGGSSQFYLFVMLLGSLLVLWSLLRGLM